MSPVGCIFNGRSEITRSRRNSQLDITDPDLSVVHLTEHLGSAAKESPREKLPQKDLRWRWAR
jgi:hypothetical protein